MQTNSRTARFRVPSTLQRGEFEMTKPDSRQPVSGPCQLTTDELDKVAGGHGVAIPPPGFENLEQTGGDQAASKAKWNRVAQNIGTHNGAISK
jgi:hypothetical protein